MPYLTNTELPLPVCSHLPSHAQDIYREAFNRAYASHAAEPCREEISHRIAWTAVKHAYAKIGDEWVRVRHDHPSTSGWQA